jgi:peptidoglycan/xylan/chitin deacetylase (PgdA/CDA1 family)
VSLGGDSGNNQTRELREQPPRALPSDLSGCLQHRHMLVNFTVRALSGPVGRRLFAPVMKDRATIFMLHRLTDPKTGIEGHSVEQVKAAIVALRESGATIFPLRDLIDHWRTEGSVPPNAVAFTIDDGFADQATLVREAFAPLNCPVTIFAIAGFLDGKLWPWDDQLAYVFQHSPLDRAQLDVCGECIEVDLSQSVRASELERVRDHIKTVPHTDLYELIRSLGLALKVDIPARPPHEFRPMTWDEAREIESLGADVAPHSVTHRIFSRLSAEEARAELTQSWERLRQELRNPPAILAWPTGRRSDFAEKDIQIARELGLRACIATDDDYAHVPNVRDENAFYRINRFSLPTNVQATLRYGSWMERGRQFLPI